MESHSTGAYQWLRTEIRETCAYWRSGLRGIVFLACVVAAIATTWTLFLSDRDSGHAAFLRAEQSRLDEHSAHMALVVAGRLEMAETLSSLLLRAGEPSDKRLPQGTHLPEWFHDGLVLGPGPALYTTGLRGRVTAVADVERLCGQVPVTDRALWQLAPPHDGTVSDVALATPRACLFTPFAPAGAAARTVAVVIVSLGTLAVESNDLRVEVTEALTERPPAGSDTGRNDPLSAALTSAIVSTAPIPGTQLALRVRAPLSAETLADAGSAALPVAGAAGTTLVILLISVLALWRIAHYDRFSTQLQIGKVHAEQASLVKTRFISQISHELRTPLHGIIGHADLMQSDLEDPLMLESASAIRVSAEHLLELVNQLLDTAKIEAEQKYDGDGPALTLLPMDLCDLIRQTVQGHEPTAKARDLSIYVNIPTSVIVIADRVAVGRVLHNLLNNAIKFTERGGVRIEMRVFSTIALVKMIDTGIGISPEDRTRLFGMFVQGTHSPASKVRGTGLGLYLTRQLIERMGGKIDVESRPGQGSTFWFELPLADPGQEDYAKDDL